jgi:hypothetical protein
MWVVAAAGAAINPCCGNPRQKMLPQRGGVQYDDRWEATWLSITTATPYGRNKHDDTIDIASYRTKINNQPTNSANKKQQTDKQALSSKPISGHPEGRHPRCTTTLASRP